VNFTRSEALTRLQLFNDKAEVICRSRFRTQVFRPDHGFSWITPGDGSMQTEWRGADEDATNALALNLRFFIHTGDKITPKQILELYDGLPVGDHEKRAIREAVDAWNQLLASPIVVIAGELFSCRSYLDVFMYGGLAHADADKRRSYEEWMKSAGSALLKHKFEKIAKSIIYIVNGIRIVNQRTITLLGCSATGSAHP
jgi:hypothetical protein